MNKRSKTKSDQSYGIVPFFMGESGHEFFIIKQIGGHWCFPKGHPEKGEKPFESAKRELLEETSLIVHTPHVEKTFSEQYAFCHAGFFVKKTVTYFLAKVENQTFALEEEELIDGKWVPAEKAEGYLTFDEGKRVCREALEVLTC